MLVTASLPLSIVVDEPLGVSEFAELDGMLTEITPEVGLTIATVFVPVRVKSASVEFEGEFCTASVFVSTVNEPESVGKLMTY